MCGRWSCAGRACQAGWTSCGRWRIWRSSAPRTPWTLSPPPTAIRRVALRAVPSPARAGPRPAPARTTAAPTTAAPMAGPAMAAPAGETAAGTAGAARAVPGPADPAGFRARVNLTIPLTTALRLTERPGVLSRVGPVDPALARDLAAAAARNPGSTWCITVTGPDGRPVAHGCGRPPPRSGGKPGTGRTG